MIKRNRSRQAVHISYRFLDFPGTMYLKKIGLEVVENGFEIQQSQGRQPDQSTTLQPAAGFLAGSLLFDKC
jgi:hypothetical protein